MAETVGIGNATARRESEFDRESELRAFDDTKAGVKGLVDAGLVKVPEIFREPKLDGDDKKTSSGTCNFQIPVIDLQGVLDGSSSFPLEVINKVRDACSRWGFFQVINHGIPANFLDKVIADVWGFHEQNTELRKGLYSRDFTKKVNYFSTFDLYQIGRANWRDTFSCSLAPQFPDPDELPYTCRQTLFEYRGHMLQLGDVLLELISQALGLHPCHLKDMGCAKVLRLAGHYYPPCPEPELTIGTSKHKDGSIITVLLQDQVGGLQVLYDDLWVDVPPKHGALVVNVGEILQLLSNDKFTSVNHRVIAKRDGPRVSVATFLRLQNGGENGSETCGPIKELLSESNPPIYREAEAGEYMRIFYSKGLNGISPLEYLKL